MGELIARILALFDDARPEAWRQSLTLAEEATQQYPYDWRAWHLRARASMICAGMFPSKRLDLWNSAERCTHRALALVVPDEAGTALAEVWLVLSVILDMQGEPAEALKAARRAATLAPTAPAPLAKLADMFRDLRRFDEADATYERALALQPGWAPALHCRSFLRFMQGRWQEAWEDYQHRWSSQEFLFTAGKPTWFVRGQSIDDLLGKPAWTGESLHNKTVLVWCEQGMGDTLWGLRYVNALQAQHPEARVVLSAPHMLVRHLEYNYPSCLVVGDVPGATLPPFDVHASLFSLPVLLKCYDPITPVPHSTPLPFRFTGKPHVGIVWGGSEGFLYDHQRSSPITAWKPVFDLTNVKLVSLQVGPREHERPEHVVNAARTIKDFSDTADVIAGLDLVVGVDTGTMHLAALMGKPTWWLANARRLDWRLNTGTTTTPWYEQARIWTMTTTWDALLAQVAAELQELR